MKNLFTVFIALVSLAGVASATICDLPYGANCVNMAGWGADPYPSQISWYGGHDGGGDFSLVVEPGSGCSDSARSASVDIDGKTVTLTATGPFWSGCNTYGQLAVNWIELDGDKIFIRHLDGLGDDSFDVEVYVNNQYVCSYADQGNSVEAWKTTECGMPVPAPEPAAILLALALASPAFAYLTLKKRE